MDAKPMDIKSMDMDCLMPHQTEAVAKIGAHWKTHHGFCLNDEMGMGKTRTAIAACLERCGPHKSFVLIVCPVQTVGHWTREIQQLSKEAHVIDTSTPLFKRRVQKLGGFDAIESFAGDGGVNFVLTSNATMSRCASRLWLSVLYLWGVNHDDKFRVILETASFLHGRYWNVVVVDESHTVCSLNTLAYQTLCSLHRHRMLLMTGTPINNHITDIVSMCMLCRISPYDIHESSITMDDREHCEKGVEQCGGLRTLFTNCWEKNVFHKATMYRLRTILASLAIDHSFTSAECNIMAILKLANIRMQQKLTVQFWKLMSFMKNHVLVSRRADAFFDWECDEFLRCLENPESVKDRLTARILNVDTLVDLNYTADVWEVRSVKDFEEELESNVDCVNNYKTVKVLRKKRRRRTQRAVEELDVFGCVVPATDRRVAKSATLRQALIKLLASTPKGAPNVSKLIMQMLGRSSTELLMEVFTFDVDQKVAYILLNRWLQSRWAGFWSHYHLSKIYLQEAGAVPYEPIQVYEQCVTYGNSIINHFTMRRLLKILPRHVITEQSIKTVRVIATMDFFSSYHIYKSLHKFLITYQNECINTQTAMPLVLISEAMQSQVRQLVVPLFAQSDGNMRLTAADMFHHAMSFDKDAPFEGLKLCLGQIPLKIQMLVQLLRAKSADSRFVVFTTYTSILGFVAWYLKMLLPADMTVGFLHGGITAKDRTRIVDAFQRGEIHVLLTSYGAGSTGITLTRADTVVFLNAAWNPFGTQTQALQRIYRIGQTRATQAVFLHAQLCPLLDGSRCPSMDDLILAAQQRKIKATQIAFGDLYLNEYHTASVSDDNDMSTMRWAVARLRTYLYEIDRFLQVFSPFARKFMTNMYSMQLAVRLLQ